MKVVVVGGGIGGLVLAHALRRSGITVRVHDRDPHVGDTGGYRLHLDSVATAVLARYLPPSLYQALLASSGGARSFRQFSFFDHLLRPLLHLPHRSPGDDLLIGRIPLRTLLTHGLSDVVRFGSEFTHLTRHDDGTVSAHFADGHTERADVLVGADGARSRVSAALAGRPTARVLRAVGLAGRTALSPGVRAALPAELAGGPAFVAGPGGTGIFLSMYDPATSDIDPASCRQVPAIIEDGYVLWGITTTALADEPGPDDARPLLAGWAPGLLALVDGAEAGSVTGFPYLAADPDVELTPWQAGAVTALGDAVHAMPPTGGQGAATAIRDADLLATHLTAAHLGTTTIPLAIHAFQRDMPAYAVPAVRESLQPLRWQQRIGGRAPYEALRRILPVADAALTTLHSGRCLHW